MTAVPRTLLQSSTLQRGMSGAPVLSLQKLLVAKGFLTSRAMSTGPGVFGPRTEEAVRAFQRAHGLSGSGIAGPDTLRALRQADAFEAPRFTAQSPRASRFDAAPAGPTVRQRPWEPINAPVRSAPSLRSRARYDEVLNQFGVGTNPRYGSSPSSVFAWDVTRAMGAELPAYEHGRPVDLRARLEATGTSSGWRQVSEAEAQAWANRGSPSLIVGRATRGPDGTAVPGLVGMVRPGQLSARGPALAVGGARACPAIPASDVLDRQQAVYWVHD